jgi:hypothetical protein
LQRLKKQDWQKPDQRVKLGKLERLWIGIRHGWL